MRNDAAEGEKERARHEGARMRRGKAVCEEDREKADQR